MSCVEELKKILHDECMVVSQEEDFYSGIIKIRTNSVNKNWKSELLEWSNKFYERDRVVLFVQVDGTSLATCNIKELDEDDSIEADVEDYSEENVVYEFELRINKSVNNGIVSVYSLSHFLEYWRSLSIQELCGYLAAFSYFNFILLFEEGVLETDRVLFSTEYRSITTRINKKEILEQHMLFVNNMGISIGDITPEDFYVKKSSGFEHEINYFNQLCLKFSYMYIANMIKEDAGAIICTVIGYKPLQIILPKEEIVVEEEVLKKIFEIYSWIYSGGSVSDKGGIARNIMSLYVNQDNYMAINEDLYSYIQSCNELYLKENVQRYVELKTNVIVIINDLNNKFIEMSEGFKGKIAKNLLALVSFYFSTIILNTIATGSIENIITSDMAILSYAFLMASFFYLLLSLWDFFICRSRYIKLYKRQKKLYEGLLIKGDIEDLFLNDKPFDEDKKEMAKTAVKYTILWVITSVILGVIIEHLSGQGFDEFIQLFRCGVVNWKM